MATDLAKLVSRLENVATRLESVANQSGGATPAESAPSSSSEFVTAFDKFLDDKLKAFVDATAKLGGDLVEQVQFVAKAFRAQREFLVVASKCREPGPSVFQELFKATAEPMVTAQEFKEKRRAHAQFNHFSCVADGIPALGWVAIANKPSVFVKESSDASQFYGNRVIKEFKGKDENHVSWVRAYYALLNGLRDYVKDNHLKKLSWNESGPVATAGTAAPAAGAPPPGPPPPGPPPPVLPPTGAPAEPKKPDMSGLFASINKGANITASLKHVSKDQMTHKNPTLRATSVVKAAEKQATTSAVKKPVAEVKKKPVFELINKKWTIEYQENKSGANQLVVDNTNMAQSVYVYRCVGSTIVVKGRVNNVTLDSCKKCAIVVDKCISGLDLINSQSIQAQVMESVPTVNVDKTDGCQVYLSKDCLTADIVSAKSSEMNIMIPKANGEFTEIPLPEQFKSRWNGKTMVTEATEVAS